MAEQVKISELERVGATPSRGTLFEVDVPEGGKYTSKNVQYKQLTAQIDVDIGLSKSRFDLRKLSAELETPTLTANIDVNGYQEAYIPSALAENSRGSLNGISAYNLCSEVCGFLVENEIPYISAESSPWVFASDVIGVSGDSTTKVASQGWVSRM